MIPPITILIEWENALDVEDEWTNRALRALAVELEAVASEVTVPPRVLYLYDAGRVRESDITETIRVVAPHLGDFCKLEFVPTPGLTYYKLKNFGVTQTTTDLVVMLDSDAAPQPGWLAGLVAPFDTPEVMAVGGFTVLGYNDLLSRVLALIWIFHLRSDRERTKKRKKINANNCAFRTAFFQANPWPDFPGYKKQCGFWLRDIDRRGIRWVRTVEAMTVHAPHPGLRFFFWRGWTAGTDRDVQAFYTVTPTRLGRLGFAVWFFLKKCVRSTIRILGKGHQVGLRPWHMPAALLLAYGYFAALFAGETWAALTRSYEAAADLDRTASDQPYGPGVAAISTEAAQVRD